MLAGILLPVFKRGKSRNWLKYYLFSVILCNSLLVFATLFANGTSFRTMQLNHILNFYLQVDFLACFFLVLVTFLWANIAVYAISYIPEDKRETLFFSCLLFVYGAILGVGLSANFFTLFLFYELVTLASYPLVVYFGTKEAYKAGALYLIYAFFGAGLIFFSFSVIGYFGQTTDFLPAGVFDATVLLQNQHVLLPVFLVGFLGFSVKAGMLPLHNWLPIAHPVAPAPASALLSGIVSKVALFAILRFTFFLFGADFLRDSWVQTVLLTLTLLTVFVGSMLAFTERLLKKRLAFSSVSQLSYIVFGIMLLHPIAFAGALLHMIAHGIAKVNLFLTAGAIEHHTTKRYVQEMRGLAKLMPIPFLSFMLVSISLIGVPPTSGFLSKMQLLLGGLASTRPIFAIFGAAILLLSALLTAGYLIPIFSSAFFPGAKFQAETLAAPSQKKGMIVPLILLAVFSLLLGMFPNMLLRFTEEISKLIL